MRWLFLAVTALILAFLVITKSSSPLFRIGDRFISRGLLLDSGVRPAYDHELGVDFVQFQTDRPMAELYSYFRAKLERDHWFLQPQTEETQEVSSYRIFGKRGGYFINIFMITRISDEPPPKNITEVTIHLFSGRDTLEKQFEKQL